MSNGPRNRTSELTHGTGIDASELLRAPRARAGISQRDLARRAGTFQSVVARIELGKTSPTVSTPNRLIEAAGFRPVVDLRGKGASSDEIARRLQELFLGIVGARLGGD